MEIAPFIASNLSPYNTSSCENQEDKDLGRVKDVDDKKQDFFIGLSQTMKQNDLRLPGLFFSDDLFVVYFDDIERICVNDVDRRCGNGPDLEQCLDLP